MKIDGVTVLQTIPQTNQTLVTIIACAFILCGLISIVTFLLGKIFHVHINMSNICSEICFINVILVFASILFMMCCNRTRYKVLVDDSVTYNELCENYNIIDIDGKITTLEEKEFTK